MNKLINSTYWWLYLILITVAVNILASQFHYRLDLTQEKRYTLSNPTKKLLRGLDGDINIDVYLKGDLKSGIKKLAISTEELLEEFEEYGKGRIHFRFFDPLSSLDDTAKKALLDSLGALGIQQETEVAQSKKGEEQSERFILPGAMVKYKDRIFPVNLLKGVSNTDANSLFNNAEALLEYEFADAIDKITQGELPVIGYAIGNGEPLDFRVYHLISGLKKNTDLRIVRLDTIRFIPPRLNALILVKPTEKFTDQEKLKLDQYLMHGGNIIYMIDNLHAEMDSIRLDRETVAYDRGLNLEDLFFRYGARINQDLVEDMQCATINFVVGMTGDKPQIQPLAWPYFPLLTGSLTHPISKNLDPVFAKFSNSVDTVKANGIKKTVLLQTSANGRIIGTPAIISVESVKLANDPKVFDRPDIPVAVLLEGKFNSLYANRISSQMADSLQNIYGQPFLPTAIKEGKIIVSGCAEIVMNDVSKSGPLPMGLNKDINYTFANQYFINNCFDYLVDTTGILETRSKDFTLRLLDPKKVEDNRSFWQIVNIILPMVLVIILGLAYQYIRKKAYQD
jgi:ABC-2 type transport system permease protein